MYMSPGQGIIPQDRRPEAHIASHEHLIVTASFTCHGYRY